MREKPIHPHASHTVSINADSRRSNPSYPGALYPSMNDSLKDDEMKFHQSQTQPQQSHVQPTPCSNAGIGPSSYANQVNNSMTSFSNPGNGPSRMKINSMQDSFLNNCRHDRTILEISLVDSTKETGVIVGFDVNTLIMENSEKFQFLIMKSAVIKIKPTRFVNYIFNDNYKYMNVVFDYSGDKEIGG